MRITALAHETGLTVDAIRKAMQRLGLKQPLNAVSIAILRDYAQNRQQRVDHIQDFRLRLPDVLPETYQEIRRVSGFDELARNASPQAYDLLRKRLAEMLSARDLSPYLRTRVELELKHGTDLRQRACDEPTN